MKDSFFTLTFFPRKPRSEGNGEYPIYARITTEGQNAKVSSMGVKGHRKKAGWDNDYLLYALKSFDVIKN